jgi:hypothetical protein
VPNDVQPLEPPDQLLQVAHEVTEPWLRRVVTDAFERGGGEPEHDSELDELITAECAHLLGALHDLLEADVDDQRSTPLSLYRAAVAGPNRWLASIGVAAPAAEPGATPERTADPYRLGPAAWSDIDPAMHEPGMTWGAWKAMTVLRRRRDDGLR